MSKTPSSQTGKKSPRGRAPRAPKPASTPKKKCTAPAGNMKLGAGMAASPNMSMMRP
jgi:hypothetical protein